MHELNSKQKAAIRHSAGPLLVIAGAGTGKTSVITHRIVHILEQKWCRHAEILALTFTEKAAAEIEERVDRLMPLGYEPISIRTFHAFCDDLLREFGIDIGLSPSYKILTGVQHWLFLKEHLFELGLDYYRPLGNPTGFIDALLRTFARFKEELHSPESVLIFVQNMKDEPEDERRRLLELAGAYGRYQELMTEHDFLDFADLQTKTLELFDQRPNLLGHLQKRYQYILVDEYQDTNIAQNRIVDLLSEKHRNLTVVGDDDQSIYKFRGAAISNILQFQERYPDAQKIVLTDNYRSNQKILDFAYVSIQHNNPDRLEVRSGVDKRLTGQRPGAEDSVRVAHFKTVDQEVEWVVGEILKQVQDDTPLGEIAILARTNAQLQAFTQALKKANIPYQFVSERGLYYKEEIRDLMALLRVLSNPSDDISFYRVLRMDCWTIPMETIVSVIAEANKNYQGVYPQIKTREECRLLWDTLRDLLEFSKTHTVGETLYRFTETVQLYQKLLSQGTLEAEEKIMNIATFFNKIRDFERSSESASVLDFVAYLDLAMEAGENPAARFETEDRDGVFISTVHGAKGLEFHAVFVVGATNDRFPSPHRSDSIPIPNGLVREILSTSDAHLQEERRLFYVASTRAKELLSFSYSDFYGQSTSAHPRPKKRTRFIDEVIEAIPVLIFEKTDEPLSQFIQPSDSFILPEATSLQRPRITQFSYSQITQFKTCPRQYEYQYLLRIPQPMSANLSFGSTMHTTLQEFYRRVLQTKQASLFAEFEPRISLEGLLMIYDERWVVSGYESRAHMEARKKRGGEILTQFYRHFSEDVSRVRFLEKGFKLKVGDYVLSGRIDRADDLPDGTLEIIDYKTGRTRSQKEVETDLQLFLYALATQECFHLKASRLTLYFLDDDVKVSVVPDEKKFEKIKKEVIETADAINASDFTPTPEKFRCAQCPYHKICDASLA